MCPSVVIVHLSVRTKNASSPDLGSAKYVQTVQSIQKLLCLCAFLLDTLYKCIKSSVLS